MRYNKSYLLLSLSVLLNTSWASGKSKVLVFPVSTKIDKSNFIDFTIHTSVSKDHVELTYDSELQKFNDAKLSITNQSNIPSTETESYDYRYTINDLSSKCVDASQTVTVSNFARIFINGSELNKDEISSDIEFDSENEQGFLKKEDELIIKTDENKILRDIPVVCFGVMKFEVELAL